MGSTLTLPVKGFWVLCRADSDFDTEFGHRQFDEADEYLNEMRIQNPELEFELIAEIDA